MIAVDLNGADTVVVLGHSASGKSTTAAALAAAHPTHRLFRTDDYREHGYEQSLYALIADLAAEPRPWIVEGVHGARLVRKMAQSGIAPDVVVIVTASEETRRSRREARGKGPCDAHDKGLDTVWRDALRELAAHDLCPRILTVDTTEEDA